MLFQTVFCFAFLGSYIFIFYQKVKAKSNRNRNCIFSSPWESQGSHTGSFLLCFTYLPQFPLQTDTYINEFVEIFLKLSTKTVQVHLIIWATLDISKLAGSKLTRFPVPLSSIYPLTRFDCGMYRMKRLLN